MTTFHMYVNVDVHTRKGVHFVQGKRAFAYANGKGRTYPPETFLTTTDEKRAIAKAEALRDCTAEI